MSFLCIPLYSRIGRETHSVKTQYLRYYVLRGGFQVDIVRRLCENRRETRRERSNDINTLNGNNTFLRVRVELSKEKYNIIGVAT